MITVLLVLSNLSRAPYLVLASPYGGSQIRVVCIVPVAVCEAVHWPKVRACGGERETVLDYCICRSSKRPDMSVVSLGVISLLVQKIEAFDQVKLFPRLLSMYVSHWRDDNTVGRRRDCWTPYCSYSF